LTVMPTTKIYYKALLSSPGDVPDERRAVGEIIHRINDKYKEKGVGMDVYVWENDVIPALVKPQIIIDKVFDYSTSDLMITIFNQRVGKGTLHELEMAEQSCLENNHPVIFLYFRNNEVVSKKLETLRKRYNRRGIATSYDTVEDFKKKCFDHIERFLLNPESYFPKTALVTGNAKGTRLGSGAAKQTSPKTGPSAARLAGNFFENRKFMLSCHTVEFIPLLYSWDRNEKEYVFGNVEVETAEVPYHIPDDMEAYFENNAAETDSIAQYTRGFFPQVRLNGCQEKPPQGKVHEGLKLIFSEISYQDFLKTNWILDEKIPGRETTFREKYYANAELFDGLSNICGVGVFILTSDDKIIVTKSSTNVKVSPFRYKFSASGTMHWDANVNPFDEIFRECNEEVSHAINIDSPLVLFLYGIDYNLGYHQFCFYEDSPYTAQQIMQESRTARDFTKEVKEIIAMPFNVENIVDHISSKDWDAPSAAALLTLAVKRFGKQEVEKYIEGMHLEKRRVMEIEWNKRALREGRLAVLSSRFPADKLEEISDSYIERAFRFIDGEYENKTVLEAGCGIGLFTKILAEKAQSVTCVDISEEMIKRNKEYVGGSLLSKIQYHRGFFQNYKRTEPTKFEMLICSLVLIHNVDDDLFRSFITRMKELSDVIYLFEHTDTNFRSGEYTKYRSKEEYLRCFPEYRETKSENYLLHTDKISFIRLQRK
jgi:SAM-dependent methyltransferase